MTNPRAFTAMAAVATLLAALSGCAGNTQVPVAGPSASPSSASPTEPRSPASPSDTKPSTDSQRAAEAARSLVGDYFTVVDRLRQQPAASMRALNRVTTSSQFVAQRRLISSERIKGLRQVGFTRIAELRVESVNLDNSDPSAGKVPTVAIDVCWDVREADLVDGRGRSVVSASRPSRGWTRYTVANYQWSKNPAEGWRVATSENLDRAPCTAT